MYFHTDLDIYKLRQIIKQQSFPKLGLVWHKAIGIVYSVRIELAMACLTQINM